MSEFIKDYDDDCLDKGVVDFFKQCAEIHFKERNGEPEVCEERIAQCHVGIVKLKSGMPKYATRFAAIGGILLAILGLIISIMCLTRG